MLTAVPPFRHPRSGVTARVTVTKTGYPPPRAGFRMTLAAPLLYPEGRPDGVGHQAAFSTLKQPHGICGLLVKRYGENVVVGSMADGEGACRPRIVPGSSGDCKDVGAAEWW
jgi:hypothetical protein